MMDLVRQPLTLTCVSQKTEITFDCFQGESHCVAIIFLLLFWPIYRKCVIIFSPLFSFPLPLSVKRILLSFAPPVPYLCSCLIPMLPICTFFLFSLSKSLISVTNFEQNEGFGVSYLINEELVEKPICTWQTSLNWKISYSTLF